MKYFKILTFILVICIVILLACYLYIKSILNVDDNSFYIYIDNETGKTELLPAGYHFIPRHVIPGEVTIYNFKKKNINLFELVIRDPSLKGLDSKSYSISVNINIKYVIDDKLIMDSFGSKFNKGKGVINNTIHKYLLSTMTDELGTYLVPNYRRNEILNKKKIILNRVIENVKGHCGGIGINIVDYKMVGGINLPPINVYNEGIRYCRELREKEKNNKKELILLNGSIKRKKDLDKMQYEKLERMSNLISKNPDILKYLYIEKLADNVKVIVAPDKSGIPLGLDNKNFPESNVKGEIDNLR